MAQRTVLVDDIDGTESKDIETVVFGVHGAWYEVDLSKKNQKALDDALAPFLGVARAQERKTSSSSTGSKRGRKSSSTETYGYEPKEVRAWAVETKWTQENGKPLGLKGVIPQGAYDAYKAAH